MTNDHGGARAAAPARNFEQYGGAVKVAPAPRGLARWVVYQRERFPVLGHGALIAAFSTGAVCFSAQLRAAGTGEAARPSAASLVVAFVSCLLFFFQLRVSDELKD